MSDWPPNPNSQNTPPSNNPSSMPPPGEAWQILEKAVLASVEEQRRARRWNIFFKLLGFGYLLLIFLILGRGCSTGEGGKVVVGSSSPHLAVVEIDGTIGAGTNNVNSEDVSEALEKAFSASGSKAVALKINSPGGSPVQSDEIWQEIKRLRTKHQDKKVYAVIGDMGASGAYYIASAADEIYVNPSSLVGSIGVIMPNYGVSELARKIGVEDRTMTAGSHKAILSPTQPVDPAERAHIQNVLNNVHSHFIAAVKAGRGQRLKENPDMFSGLFWTGEQAIGLGLADKTGSVTTLARELKLNKAVDYTVQRNPLESILGRMGSSIGQGIGNSIQQGLTSQKNAELQ
ncbi:signal peptide peptidase SppA [Alkanindiges sp. WGS2144]|uniref:signal peptide peptidase SppA n=1 Tax=Alkanindiges sp. WGS2144 TaxID=3366808 RepID=UPI0037518101